MVDELLQALLERQMATGLSDRAFAELLGVHHSQWSRVRRKTAKPGIKFLKGISRAFPELSAIVAAAVN